MPIENLEERMAAMQPAFDGTGGPPDGVYQAVVDRFDFFEAPGKGAFLKTELTIHHDPRHAGHPVEMVHALEDPKRIGFLKRHLATLGVDVGTLDLRLLRPSSPLLTDLLDVPVEIAIKTSAKRDENGIPYRNVYLNRRLGGPIRASRGASDVPSDFVVPAAEDATDDIQF